MSRAVLSAARGSGGNRSGASAAVWIVTHAARVVAAAARAVSGAAASARPTVRRAEGLAAALLATLATGFLPAPGARAQPGPAPGGPPLPPREAAPFDMTGYWVSIVNEDWRWRMVTPPKGDYTSLTMLNARARAVADEWDPSEDGSCKAYGAAALLRMPTRLEVAWASDDVLRLQTDAGEQTRLLRFASEAPAGAPSLQGDSAARWQLPRRPGRPRPGTAPPPGGSLAVTTTNLTPGWLRLNGVPYSEETTVTEYFDRFEAPNGDEWLVVTTIVEDPVYLTGRYVTSSHFKREPDASNWSPEPCRND